MDKSVEERARDLAKERTDYGGRENPPENVKKFYESPTGYERDAALGAALKDAFKKDVQEIKKKVKKKIQRVKSYFSKNKPYSNKPRPTKTNSQKLKKYKVYIPPKP